MRTIERRVISLEQAARDRKRMPFEDLSNDELLAEMVLWAESPRRAPEGVDPVLVRWLHAHCTWSNCTRIWDHEAGKVARSLCDTGTLPAGWTVPDHVRRMVDGMEPRPVDPGPHWSEAHQRVLDRINRLSSRECEA